RRLHLVNDAREPRNNWISFGAQNLTLAWVWEKITTNSSAEVGITLYGYWEDVKGHSLKQIGYLVRRHPNSAPHPNYMFNP
ncbi:AMOP domain protein, partial [Aphelenchoides avenae]